MATAAPNPSLIIERMPSDQIIPQIRRRESVAEVIDVDELDDSQIYQPPTQRRRLGLGHSNFVDLLDSDDEAFGSSVASGSSSQPVASGSGLHRGNRLFSPPPPPASDDPVPPVPYLRRPLPRPRHRHHSGHSAISSAAPPAGVIRGHEEPFGFELRMSPSPPRRLSTTPGVGGGHRRQLSPPMRATAPRHPTSFGGALLMQIARRGLGAVDDGDPTENDAAFARQLFLAENTGLDLGQYLSNRPRAFSLGWFGGGPKKDEMDYKPSYTHPDNAEPGFTFDFTPPEVPSSANNPIVIDDDDVVDVDAMDAPPKDPVRMSLVCVYCQDPFLLEGGDANDEEEARNNKIWSLRCGHVVDGKCLDKLAVPIPVLGQGDSKRKGKGKGKAKATDEDQGLRDYDVTSANPIRSRLRSSVLHLLPESPTPQKRARKPKKVKVEQEHRWECPVLGCGKEHTSVKIGGIWGPEKERGEGAIGLFV